MKANEILTTAVLAAVLSSLPRAQEPTTPTVPDVETGDLFVPLHTHPSDPSYGTWAAGAEWKARFDTGFTFFAWLGQDAPRVLPWRFETLGLRQGNAYRPARADDRSEVGGERYQLHRDGFVERYEVSTEGVEQSFVVEHSIGEGDLVIEGRITTGLREDRSAPRHGAVDFHDDAGRDVVRYGAAFALDAQGRRLSIDTSVEEEVLQLTVPGAWLAEAQWPVTIDPLTQSTTLNALAANVRSSGITYSRSHHEICMSFTRRFAANVTISTCGR